MSELKAYHQKISAIPFQLSPSKDVPEIEMVLNRSLLSDGKRTRPLFLMLMANLFGLRIQDVKRFIQALERTHAAFLAHDDVIDEADSRRGKRSLHRITSNPQAILAGDLLMAQSALEVAQFGNTAITADYAQMLKNTVEGEWLQLESRMQVELSQKTLIQIAIKKTGSLLIWAAQIPAHLKKADSEIHAQCRYFAECIGIGFQMIDDVLDFSHHSGKPFSNDLKEGQINFVTHDLIQAHPELISKFKAVIGKPEASYPWDEKELKDALLRIRNAAALKLQAAKETLHDLKLNLDDHPERESSFQLLLQFIQQLEKREK